MKNSSKIDSCPVTTTQNVLAGKWKIIMIWHLSTGTKRFNELQKLLFPISQTMLTSQLRELEQDGLVQRRIFPEVPPRVEYSLTTIGIDFMPVMEAMMDWGEKYEAYENV